jgi:hypothetical protein
MPIDYYGNITDDHGNYLGQDFYNSDMWKEQKAANDELQAATQGARDAEAAAAANPTAENQAALERAKARASSALVKYTRAGTAPPPAKPVAPPAPPPSLTSKIPTAAEERARIAIAPVPTGEPVSTILLTIGATLFGIFGRGLPASVKKELVGLRDAIKDVANALIRFAWWIAHSLRWALGTLRALWERIVKPLLEHIDRLTARLARIIDKVLLPYLEFLQRIRQIILDIYARFFLPIIEVVQMMRQAIALLRLLRVPGMKKLDEKLQRIEAKLIGIITDLLRRTNEHSGLINVLLTARMTLQRPLLTSSFSENRAAWINQFYNYQSVPVTTRKPQPVTSVEIQAIVEETCVLIRNVLLSESAGVFEPVDEFCRIVREGLLRE